jgi:hypothetical protein
MTIVNLIAPTTFRPLATDRDQGQIFCGAYSYAPTTVIVINRIMLWLSIYMVLHHPYMLSLPDRVLC